MSLLNPMALDNNPRTTFVQPDYRVPASQTNLGVANYPVGANVLSLTWPLPVYTQPTSPSDVPNGYSRT